MALDKRREELAWAAGFWDGEGCSGNWSFGIKGYPERKPQRVCRAILGQKTSPLLTRFKEAVGFGKVYGPYLSSRNQMRWQVQSFEHVQAVAAILWSWLGESKRSQFRKALGK